MQASDIPTKMPTIWASSATAPYVAPVPVAPPGPAGRASFQTGFPPPNFVDPLAGGVPPFGEDVNGLEQAVTAWLRWLMAGGIVPYDGTFQSAIGGYPAGARVASAATAGLVWISTTDNNVTNPDAAGAGWLQVGSFTIQQITGVGVTNVTVPAYCASVFIQGWGGGGGGSGSNGSGIGASGSGGGYAAGWFSVAPGQTLVCTVPLGGLGALNGNTAGDGGTMTVVRSAVTLLSANGGNGGGAGPGPGGIGTIGQILYQGGPGTDLDGLIGSGGTVMAAPGGDGAGCGGKGGVVNAAGTRLGPNQPGGGGGANYFVNAGSGGSAGEIDLFFKRG